MRRLDIDQLLRLEVGRARDSASLLGLRGDSQERAADVVRECKFREEWRRRWEGTVLEAAGGEEPERTVAAYMRRTAFRLYRECDREQASFLCLGSWSCEAGNASLQDLVSLSQSHHSSLLAWHEWKYLGLMPHNKSQAPALPTPEERPSNIVQKKVEHRVFRLRKMYNVYLIQRAARGFLARRASRKKATALQIARWYRYCKYQSDLLQSLARKLAAVKLQSFFKKCLLKRLLCAQTIDFASLEHFSPKEVTKVQSYLRVWLAKLRVARLRWETKLHFDAALMKRWRKSRMVWNQLPFKGQVHLLASTRVQTERQLIEIAMLRTVEEKRCAAQFRIYEKKLAAAVEKSKLPPGWVQHQAAQDDAETQRGLVEHDSDEDSAAVPNDDTDKDWQKKGKLYLNLKSGKVVNAHPNAVKAEEMRRKELGRAKEQLVSQLERLDSFAHIIKLEQRLQRDQVARCLLQTPIEI